MAKVLTDAAIKKYKPTAERRVIRDAQASSLYLVVQPSGAKSWLMRFRRPDGKVGKIVLGSFDASGRELEGEPQIGMPLSLVAARQLAAEVHRQRALGKDVVADHKQRRQRGRSATAGTFGALVRRYVAEHARIKTRRWRDAARLLGLDYPTNGDGEPTEIPGGLAQRWGSRDADAITGHDVWSVVEEARATAVPGLKPLRKDQVSGIRAGYFFAAVSGLFGWLKKRRLIATNPAADVAAPEKPRARDRVLTDAEIAKVWRAAEKLGAPRQQIVRLLLLTGCRVREVAGMRRDELSEDGATWTIPGARTKNRRPHVLILPALATDLIATAPEVSAEFVFSVNGRTAASLGGRPKKLLDLSGVGAWRLHDIRRTTATGMANIGIAPHIIEAVLNHISGARAGVAGIYNRAAYAPEKKSALQRWASHVEGLVTERPSRVVSIKGRRT